MNKTYDQLLIMLLEKLREYFYKELSKTLLPIGAFSKQPTGKDVEYICLVTAVYLLHVHEVDIDTNFPDIAEMKPDMLEALASFDKIKDKLTDYLEEHKAANSMPPFDFGSDKAEA